MDSGINDFFRQLPFGFVLMFCGSSILLLFALVYIVRARAQRVRAAVPPAQPPDADDAAPPLSTLDLADLPDLDELAGAELIQAAAPPQPPAVPPRPAGTYSLKLTDGSETDVVEVLTILRDVTDGGLIIRIGEQAYRNPPAVADAEFKRRFNTTLRDLSGARKPVAGAAEPAPVSAPPAAAAAAVAAAAAAPIVDAPAAAPPSAPPEIPRTPAYEPAPGDLPKFRMPDGPPVKPKRGQRPAQEPIPEIDVAGSIEAFLQHKLSMAPQYASRSIHVRGALHGGVAIEVDGKFYETVGEVDDAAVRQFLSATIEEWQARQ